MNLHEGDVYRAVCPVCSGPEEGSDWRGTPKKREDLARIARDVHNRESHAGGQEPTEVRKTRSDDA